MAPADSLNMAYPRSLSSILDLHPGPLLRTRAVGPSFPLPLKIYKGKFVLDLTDYILDELRGHVRGFPYQPLREKRRTFLRGMLGPSCRITNLLKFRMAGHSIRSAALKWSSSLSTVFTPFSFMVAERIEVLRLQLVILHKSLGGSKDPSTCLGELEVGEL